MKDKKDKNEELTPREKLEQENFVMKSKLIIKGASLDSSNSIDPEIENTFLKNVFAFEEAEYKVVYEILGIAPTDFPAAETLSDKEIEKNYERLVELLEKHNMYVDMQEGLPAKLAYKYLIEEYLFEETQEVSGFDIIIDGCSGDCPGCFQMDYCNIKDDIWPPEKLKAEIKRREQENK